MITSLCNLVDDFNMDTFYLVNIIKTSNLPRIDHLTDPEYVASILNNDGPQRESIEGIAIPLLPESFSVASSNRFSNQNEKYSHSISFPVVPMDKNLRNLFKSYSNQEVMVLLTRKTFAQLYGTTRQPLLFSYDELHASGKTALKGFNLRQSGETYGPPIYFDLDEISLSINNNALAFELAGEL